MPYSYIPAEKTIDSFKYKIAIILDSPKNNTEMTYLKSSFQNKGFDLNDVFITNVLKVKLPEGRSPYNAELESWKESLFAELGKHKFDHIVLVGQRSLDAFGIKGNINSIRGKFQAYQDTELFFMLDLPKVVQNSGLKAVFEQDIQLLKARNDLKNV